MSRQLGYVVVGVVVSVVLSGCENPDTKAYRAAAPKLTPVLTEIRSVDKDMKALPDDSVARAAAAQKACTAAGQVASSILAIDVEQLDVSPRLYTRNLQRYASKFRDAQTQCLSDARKDLQTAAQFHMDPGDPDLTCVKGCLEGWPKIVDSANALSNDARQAKVDLP